MPAAFGPGYGGAVPVLLVLLPGNMCYGLAAVISVYFTNHVGAPQIPMKVSGLAMGINLVACLFLIPRVGSIGAAAASTVAYLAGIAVYCRIFVKMTGLPARSLVAGRQEWREQILRVRSIVCRTPSF
jgi:O-antigen/teichoic acid export membrane protein